MQTLFSPFRAALAARATEATSVAADPGSAPPATATGANGQGGLDASPLDSLPPSELDALLPDAGAQVPTADARSQLERTSALDMTFKVRDLTLPYGAFASAAPRALPPAAIAAPAEKQLDLGKGLDLAPDGREIGGDRLGGLGKGRDIFGVGGGLGFNLPGGGVPRGPDIDPRADPGDGDGSGKQPGGRGPTLPGGGVPGGIGVKLPGGWVPGGDPDLDPRADWGDGDGDGTGNRPGKFGPKGPRGGDSDGAGGFGFGGFHAFDIDYLVPHYRDPDLDPRAQDGGCGATGCGTTNTPDCGATGCGTTNTPDCGATGCGTTNTPDCGATGCGTTNTPDCGATGCGTTNTPDCGATGCGTTNTPGCGATGCGTTNTPDCGASGCGTTNSPGRDPFTVFSRTELLREQLATQLAVVNAKLSI